MPIINVGSLNIDHVYGVSAFVRPGETITTHSYHSFAGGKGFNQSVALARAGASVLHVGNVGPEGHWLVDKLKSDGINTSRIQSTQTPTGHAIIQVVPSGENAIFLFPGANHTLSLTTLFAAFEYCEKGSYFLTQNETNGVADAIRAASARGLQVVFNPAPMTPAVLSYPLELVDLFILNETEAESLTGTTVPQEIQNIMRQRFPNARTVLTLGKEGAIYFDSKTSFSQPALLVEAVDTTGAGDTFIGFFLAELAQNKDPRKALSLGCAAAALCVTKPGASDSIPYRSALEHLADKLNPSFEIARTV